MDSNNSNFQKLYAVCKEFWEKIDKCVNEHRDLFVNFPHGYCDHICIWAFDYLTSKGYTNIEFHIHDPFLPDRGGSHVWLYWNGFNMDFSCDQFSLNGGEQYASVIVIETTVPIKVMKRNAYGFRDEKYFKLRLYALHDCLSFCK